MSAKMGICSKCGQRKRLTKDGLLYLHDTPKAVECSGSRRPVRQILEKNTFDELVESQRPETPDIETLWDGIKALWGPLYGDEGYLVKGMILLECVDTDGERNFMWVTSPYMSSWDQKGMVAQLQEEMATDMAADSMFKALTMVQQFQADAEEDEDEDEQ